MNVSPESENKHLAALQPVIIDGELAVSDIVDDPECHFLPAPAFTVQEGFSVAYNLGNSLFSCARDAVVRKYQVPGRLWHWFPKTGKFHIGFVLIDDADRTFSFDFFIQKQFCFNMTATRADGLRHIYFTDKTFDVQYAQTLEMRFTGDGSRQAVEGLVFLAESPAERMSRFQPIRVRREPLNAENPPLREFHLHNPGGFRLRHELLRIPLPAPWPDGTDLRLGRHSLPFVIKDGEAAEILFDNIMSKKATVRVDGKSVNTAAGKTQDTIGLTVKEAAGEIIVEDDKWNWQVGLEEKGFRLTRGEKVFHFALFIEGVAGELPLVSKHLEADDNSRLSVAACVSFEFEGFLHSTRLRFVKGSSRVELEHLLEVHAKEPFYQIRRYGFRITGESGTCEPRIIAIDGSNRPVPEFQSFHHSEHLPEHNLPGLGHSLLWGNTQFTIQEMRFSAPISLCGNSRCLEVALLPQADTVKLDPDCECRLRNQFFIQDGLYKLRGGMARRHFSCLQTKASDAPSDILYEASRLDEPPYLHVPCHQKGLRIEIDPPFARRRLYQDALRRRIDLFLANRSAVRAFGFFGYGDWFGERVNNWGNSEYDTPYGFLTNFMVSGDAMLRRLGFAAARHQMDVDTHHGDHPKAGWQITHSMAHGGGYFPDEYRTGAYAHGGEGVAHVWVEGMLLYWRLTGDQRAKAVAVRLLDDLAGSKLKNWMFTTGRDAGWHLIHLCAGYRELRTRKYLDAAATLTEKILERQRKDGSFRRVLYSDHCLCYPKHTGEVSFMMGYLLEGFKRFHVLTGDTFVREAIITLSRSVVAEMWDPVNSRFRYTSCPNSGAMESAMLLEGLSYAARLTDDHSLLSKWRRELKTICAINMPSRIVQGELIYGNGACGKIISQHLRMLADVCDELL